MRLYQLPAAFAEIEAMTCDDGELSSEAMEKLTSLEMALESKIEACCRVVRHFEANATAYKTEAERLSRNAAAAASNAKRLKEYMQMVLETLNLPRVETELFKVRIQHNPPSVKISESVYATRLPEEFQRVIIEPDKSALMEAFKSGKELPIGVTVVQTSSLRIS